MPQHIIKRLKHNQNITTEKPTQTSDHKLSTTHELIETVQPEIKHNTETLEKFTQQIKTQQITPENKNINNPNLSAPKKYPAPQISTSQTSFQLITNLTQRADIETLKRVKIEALAAKLHEKVLIQTSQLDENEKLKKQWVNEIFVLKKSLARARGDCSTQLDRKRIADGEIAVLKDQLVEARKQTMSSAERGKVTAESERSSFELERKCFRGEVSVLEDRVEDLQKQLLESTENIRLWSSKFQQQSQRNLGLTHEITQQRERLVESQIEKKRLEQWRDQVKQKAIDMRTTGQVNESLKDQLRHFDKKHALLVENCRDLELEVLDKNTEICAMKRELDEAVHDLVENERDKVSLEKRLKRLTQENNNFQKSDGTDTRYINENIDATILETTQTRISSQKLQPKKSKSSTKKNSDNVIIRKISSLAGSSSEDGDLNDENYNGENFTEDNFTDTQRSSSKIYKHKKPSSNYASVKLPVEKVNLSEAGAETKKPVRKVKSAW